MEKEKRYWEEGRRYGYSAIDEVNAKGGCLRTVICGLTHKEADLIVYYHNQEIDRLFNK